MNIPSSSSTASAAATDDDDDDDDDAAIIGVTTTIRRRAVKKEEEEVLQNNQDDDDDDDDDENNGSITNYFDSNNLATVKIKKEEGNNYNENENDDDENNNAPESSIDSGASKDYSDWKNGNWCWLLPPPAIHTTSRQNNNNNNNNNNNSVNNCTTTTNSVVKSEDDSNTNAYTNNAARVTTTGPTSIDRSMSHVDEGNDNDCNDKIESNDDEDDENKPSPKKKMRQCSPINDIVKKEEEEVEEVEENMFCAYEANNNTTTTSDNDNDNYSNNNNEEGGDDEAGYESWTEGNWCLLLPLPPPVVDEIETTGTSSTRPTRRRSDGDGDGNDNVASAKSKKRTYTKWQNERWDEMFQRLVAYKKEHKSTNVSWKYEADPKLGKWVQTQRKTCGNKNISVKRIRRLDSIGFVWKMYDLVPWEEMYKRLVAYKKKHKSTNVPWLYQADPKLGSWVHTQRRNFKKKKLSIERINHLELIGFVWDPFDTQWMEMYHKLVEYKKQYMSTKVPSNYTNDPSLGIWVSTQRGLCSRDILSGKRLELLNSINFAWFATNDS